jgi:uncharacterized protein (DUF2141 family)
MPKLPLPITCFTALLLLFSRCAQITPLTGGKKDTVPPQLVKATPLSATVNFTGTTIAFEFDELVQLRDLSNQFIIAPAVKTEPEITAEGKRIIVRFKKNELRENTTYKLSFGRSIADMHESNPIEKLDYIFTTGNHIDTLTLTGKVTDALSGDAGRGVVVALRSREVTDSAAYQTPEYYIRTNDGGQFTFTNLPPEKFYTFAFADKNKNNLYDRESEKVAFSNEPVVVGRDSSVSLRLFTEDPLKLFVKKISTPEYGVTHVILNRPGKGVVKPLDPKFAADLRIVPGDDTITAYYKSITDTMKLVFQNGEELTADTLVVNLPKRKEKKRFRLTESNIRSGILGANEDLRVTFPYWMDSTLTRTKQLRLRKKNDSTDLSFRLTWKDLRTAVITASLAPETDYVLKADSGAFTSIYQLLNDSISLSFHKQGLNELGKLTIQLKATKKTNYLVQLLDEKDNLAREVKVKLSLSSSNAVDVDFTELQPASYKVRVVFDENGNGKWDTGDVIRKRQPEEVKSLAKQIKVTGDWEIVEPLFVDGGLEGK